eukprot:TRINITY_DN9977_c0_g1_i5.p2 TRINITY_DN9977_c0_g1~~TRINITY_DN9977_c0_g1_i5.p2  ORF type:complete len:211 (-),score=-15.10 TRINITY_DN9977_c0_g1_i5:384-1016(-)
MLETMLNFLQLQLFYPIETCNVDCKLQIFITSSQFQKNVNNKMLISQYLRYVYDVKKEKQKQFNKVRFIQVFVYPTVMFKTLIVNANLKFDFNNRLRLNILCNHLDKEKQIKHPCSQTQYIIQYTYIVQQSILNFQVFINQHKCIICVSTYTIQTRHQINGTVFACFQRPQKIPKIYTFGKKGYYEPTTKMTKKILEKVGTVKRISMVLK